MEVGGCGDGKNTTFLAFINGLKRPGIDFLGGLSTLFVQLTESQIPVFL